MFLYQQVPTQSMVMERAKVVPRLILRIREYKWVVGATVFLICAGPTSVYADPSDNRPVTSMSATECGQTRDHVLDVVFDLEQAVIRREPFRFGTNILFWVETKSDWDKYHLTKSLKELGVKVLRFPGGEVADNYDWENNEVERDEMFPKEAATIFEKNNRLDFLTFLANAQDAGVEDIYFVTNLEGAFLRPGNRQKNIITYAKSAARWVKAVQKAGYRVRYWEIGNESYHHSAFPLTAREYAEALIIFSREMKAVDPSILIGANGPWSPEDVSFADRLRFDILDSYRSKLPESGAFCKKAGRDDCIKVLNRGIIHLGKPWWPEVISLASSDFDFAVVHRYGYSVKAGGTDGLNATLNGIISLKQMLNAANGKNIPIAMTEWNVPSQQYDNISEGEHAIEVAAQLIKYYRSGINDSLFWPFRMEDGFYSLLDLTSNERNAAYKVLSFLSVHTMKEETIFFQSSSLSKIEIMLSRNSLQGDTIISAVNVSKNCLNLKILNFFRGDFTIKILEFNSYGDHFIRNSKSNTEDENADMIVLSVPPRSMIQAHIVLYKFNR